MFLRQNKHIVLLIVLFVALVVFEYMQPKEIDWTISFKKEDKIPFGSYIMFDLLEDVFPDSKIETNSKSPFILLKDSTLKNYTYIIITQKFNPIKANLHALLNFVGRGNKVFISALNFGEGIKDSLNFSSETFYPSLFKRDSLNYNFFNKKLKTDSGYYIKSSSMGFYIDSVDNNAENIAYMGDDKTIFFRQKHGKGEFLINVQPFAYTNYNILQNNNIQYVLKSLSFARNSTIVWDEYYAYNKYNRSAMSYVLSQKSLRIAWYLLLALVTVYLFFGSKRRQRVIPVIKKPINNSLEFAKTLANLYLSGKNHKDMALKKHYYWLNFLRRKYFLKIEKNQILNIAIISEKTGVPKALIKGIIDKKQDIDLQKTISPETLLKFNELIDEFYLQNK